MPRIKKQEAEVKNKIIQELLAHLDEVEHRLNALYEHEGLDTSHVQMAAYVVRNALHRRRS